MDFQRTMHCLMSWVCAVAPLRNVCIFSGAGRVVYGRRYTYVTTGLSTLQLHKHSCMMSMTETFPRCDGHWECAKGQFCGTECWTGECGKDKNEPRGRRGKYCQPCAQCKTSRDSVTRSCDICPYIPSKREPVCMCVLKYIMTIQYSTDLTDEAGLCLVTWPHPRQHFVRLHRIFINEMFCPND